MAKTAICGWSALGSIRYITKTLLSLRASEMRSQCTDRNSILLAMKLTFVLLTAAFLNVSASGISQNVSFSGQNVPLTKVFDQVKKQTGYVITYTESVLAGTHPISLQVKNIPLEEFLKKLLADQPVSYLIDAKTILLVRKSTSSDRQLSNTAGITSLSLADILITIRGRVLDEKGEPIEGATATIKGSNKGTTTNGNGNFELNADKGDVLVVTYIGYVSKEIKLTSDMFSAGNTLTISLSKADIQLDTAQVVINTGYQKVSEQRMTGSVVSVGREELEKRNAVNIMQNLEGAVPGLVQFRGNAVIRGVGTLNANTAILVVVDGLPIEGSIADINPYDVESINVLKDAAAAAIYGARASNGVIVVTTKRAKEKARTTVEVSGNITITNKPDYSYRNDMTAAQQVDWESDYYNWYYNGGSGQPLQQTLITVQNRINTGGSITPVNYAYYQLNKGQITQTQFDASINELKANDFAGQFKEHALLNGLLQQYNLALRTNNGKTQSSLVVNYTTDNSGIINAYNRRLNLFYKGTYSPSNWLDIDYGVNSVIGRQRSHTSRDATNPFNVPSYYRLLNSDGSKAYYTLSDFNAYSKIGDTLTGLNSFGFNHLDELGRDFTNTSSMNTRYYVNLNLKILKGLTINPMFQYEDNTTRSSAYSEAESYNMRFMQNAFTRVNINPSTKQVTYNRRLPAGGRLASSELISPSYTARIQANYDRTLGKHRVSGIGGFEIRQMRSYGKRGVLLGYNDQLQTQLTNNFNFGILDTVTSTPWLASYPTGAIFSDRFQDFALTLDEMHRFASAYGNITYTYDGKYNLFGSLRKDYADLFGGDEKYRGKPLWSAGASWIISNEDFLKNTRIVNYLKLRGSYGFSGNIRYATAKLAATTGTNRIIQVVNASIQNPPNPGLRWEKTATTNIGLDFGLLENRLKGSFDFYRKIGTDLFAERRLDPTEGFTTLVTNNASMKNHGVELMIAYDWFRPVQPDGFRWTTNLIGAWNKNRITEVDTLNPPASQIAGGQAFRLGYPVNSIFSFQFAGLDGTGMPLFYDSKGNKTTTALGINETGALVYSGESVPTRSFSINNDFSLKGFTVSVFAVYYGGHYFRARPVPASLQNPQYSPLPVYLLNGWTPTNTDTDVPGSGQYFQPATNTQYFFADNLVRRADFIKIRNIVFGYDLPRHVVSKIRGSNLRVRFQLNDPKAIWTKQTDVHVDPETGIVPVPTSFVFGINANF